MWETTESEMMHRLQVWMKGKMVILSTIIEKWRIGDRCKFLFILHSSSNRRDLMHSNLFTGMCLSGEYKKCFLQFWQWQVLFVCVLNRAMAVLYPCLPTKSRPKTFSYPIPPNSTSTSKVSHRSWLIIPPAYMLVSQPHAEQKLHPAPSHPSTTSQTTHYRYITLSYPPNHNSAESPIDLVHPPSITWKLHFIFPAFTFYMHGAQPNHHRQAKTHLYPIHSTDTSQSSWRSSYTWLRFYLQQ